MEAHIRNFGREGKNLKRLIMATLAFGLLRCWSWMTFMENAASDTTTALFAVPMQTLAEIFIGSWGFLTIPAALLIVGRTPPARRAWAIAGCLLTICIAALALVPHGESVDKIAAVAAGGGFAILFLLCTDLFLETDMRSMAIAQCAVACISIVLIPLYFLMNDTLGGIYILLFLPGATATLLVAASRERIDDGDAPDPPSIGAADRIVVARIVALCLIVNLCCGMLHGILVSAHVEAYEKYYRYADVSYIACSLLLGWALYRFRGMRYETVCKIALPLIAVGFILFPLLGARLPVACFLFIQSGFALFNIFDWICLLFVASLFPRKNRPLVAGVAIFIWTTSTCVGMALPDTMMASLALASGEHPAVLATVAGVLLSFAWLLTPEGIGPRPHYAAQPRSRLASQEDPAVSFGLTRQETIIFELLAEGMKNTEICASLNIAENTLRTHLKNIYRKTGIGTRKQLVTTARRERVDGETQ